MKIFELMCNCFKTAHKIFTSWREMRVVAVRDRGWSWIRVLTVVSYNTRQQTLWNVTLCEKLLRASKLLSFLIHCLSHWVGKFLKRFAVAKYKRKLRKIPFPIFSYYIFTSFIILQSSIILVIIKIFDYIPIIPLKRQFTFNV